MVSNLESGLWTLRPFAWSLSSLSSVAWHFSFVLLVVSRGPDIMCARGWFRVGGALPEHERGIGRLAPWPAFWRSALLEELGATFGLRIAGMLDLQPARGGPVALIRAAGVLPNDSFKIAIAGQLEESHARSWT
jgi:hypothetical protein